MAPIPVTPNNAEIAAAMLDYIKGPLSCGDVPVFGSAAWVELADDDPAKHAAVVRAALAHWTDQLGRIEAHVEASHAVSAAHDWGRQASRPSRAQVLQWRAEV